MSDKGSVTICIENLKAGDPAAAEFLWDRYFGPLVGLARKRLKGARRLGGVAGSEDAALDVVAALCQGAAAGKFPRLEDRNDLWRLMVKITTHKAINLINHHGRQKRGGGITIVGEGDADEKRVFDLIAGSEPTPEAKAVMAEQFQALLDELGDPTLQQIALGKLAGLTDQEIADELGCVRRTVQYKLDIIRKKLRGYDS